EGRAGRTPARVCDPRLNELRLSRLGAGVRMGRVPWSPTGGGVMSTVSRPAVQRLVLDNIAWATYLRLLRALAERPGLPLTDDRGGLEIMPLTYGHESAAALLGRMVVALTEELNLPLASGGSTTFRRRKYRRGLEADECYWILNEHRIRGKRRIDLRVDPPPD